MADELDRNRDNEEMGQTNDEDIVNSADDEEFEDVEEDDSDEEDDDAEDVE